MGPLRQKFSLINCHIPGWATLTKELSINKKEKKRGINQLLKVAKTDSMHKEEDFN